jgi:hypothetical protein
MLLHYVYKEHVTSSNVWQNKDTSNILLHEITSTSTGEKTIPI